MWVKPKPPVRINRKGLGRGLVHLGPFGRSQIEAVTGKPGSFPSGGSSADGFAGVSPYGDSWDVSNLHDGGLAFAPNPGFYQFTDKCTLFVWARIDTMGAYANLIGVPYDDDAFWGSPYLYIGLVRNSSGTEGRFHWASSSSTFDTGNSLSGFIETGVYHLYAVTRDGATVSFYRDGMFHSSTTTGTGNFAAGTDQLRVFSFSRDSTAADEGATGNVVLTGIWNRALPAKEINELYCHPERLLASKVVPFPEPSGGGPAPGLSIPVAMHNYRRMRA